MKPLGRGSGEMIRALIEWLVASLRGLGHMHVYEHLDEDKETGVWHYRVSPFCLKCGQYRP